MTEQTFLVVRIEKYHMSRHEKIKIQQVPTHKKRCSIIYEQIMIYDENRCSSFT